MTLNARSRRLDAITSSTIVLATVAVYWRMRDASFLTWDDASYVVSNPHVRDGLTWDGVRWALTTFHGSNWHPVTWLSHMLDGTIFGTSAAGPHLENVLIHAVSAALLFLILVRLTGSRWPSALTSGLFALHPSHVESVAWIAERKDVLSGLFWILTIEAWTRYLRKPVLGRYLLSIAVYALGLMTKPTLVGLPIVLLLLETWPLGRFARPSPGSERRGLITAALFEKIPFFLLAGACAVVTYFAQHATGAMMSDAEMSVGLRVANALVSYVRYLATLAAPMDLSPFYPMPPSWPLWVVALCALTLTGVTWMAVRQFPSRPWIAVGWLWYLTTMVPTIGLVQVGGQAMADRYLYIPSIGIFLIAAWALQEVKERQRSLRAFVSIGAASVVAACAFMTWRQTGYWRDSITLFSRAIATTSDNYLAHNNLGVALAVQQRYAEAGEHFSEALAIKPDYAEAHVNLASVLARRGDLKGAMGHLTIAAQLRPDSPEILAKLQWVSRALARPPGAAER